jgi:fumarate hydratase class II
MSKTRIERDSFGPIDVPAGRLWGAQTQRSLEFSVLGDPCHELILALAPRRAAAAVNRDLGLLEPQGERSSRRPTRAGGGRDEDFRWSCRPVGRRPAWPNQAP